MEKCKTMNKTQRQLIRDKIGKIILISIGINKYENEQDKLTICEKDARDIYSSFAENKKITFAKEESMLLDSKEKTTLESFLKSLSVLCEKSQKDKQFILFFSGHGVNIDGEFHFIFSDSDPTEPGSMLPIGDVVKKLNESKFKGALLLIDACQTILRGRKSLEDKTFSSQKKFISNSNGIAIIYSCTVGEYSQENVGKLKNSVFTSLLLEALSGKRDALDGHYLSAGSLYKYVTYESQKISAEYQQVSQHPHFQFDGCNDIYIALLDEDAATLAGEKNKCTVSVKNRPSIFKEEEFLGKLICKLESDKWELLQTLVNELLYNIYKNNENVNCEIQVSRSSITLIDDGKKFDPRTIEGKYDKNSSNGFGAELLERVRTKIPGVEYDYENCDKKNNFKIQFLEQIFVLDKMCTITVDINGFGDESIQKPSVISEYYYYIVPDRTMAISQCRDISKNILKILPNGSKLVVIDNTSAPESIIRALGIDNRLIYSRY